MTDANKQTKGSNGGMIALVVLVVVAIGALIFLAKNMNKDSDGTDTVAVAENTATPPTEGATETETAEATPTTPPKEIKPGNPVVAKVNGREIKRVDVFNFIQGMGQNVPQMPIDQLFPLALDQVINAQIIDKKVDSANLDNDPAVAEQLKVAKEQIERRVFMEKAVNDAMTEDRLKAAYDQYVKNFPEIEEVKTRHILVKEESLAKELITQIQDGGDFAELAKANSIDATKDKGGDLGYIAKQDQVIPEYIDAVFAMKVGDVSKKPLKSEFGYHVIEVQDTRMRPAADFEQAKPFLASQLRGEVLNDLLAKWRTGVDATIYDINGEPIEPAAGEEKIEAPATEKNDG